MTEIVNLPTMYMDGCNLSFATTTTLGVTAGQVRDSTNNFDIVIANPLTISGTSIGLNGLDTGALDNNKFYNVFIIGDSSNFKPAGALISLSATPILPFGYNLIRLVGVWLTNGTANFLPIYQSGSATERTYFYDAPVSVLTDGAATAFTPVVLSAGVPSINGLVVLFNTAYTPQAVNNTFTLRPTGSSSSATVLQNGIAAGVQQDAQIQMPILLAAGNPSLDYKVINAGDKLSLFVAGFNISL